MPQVWKILSTRDTNIFHRFVVHIPHLKKVPLSFLHANYKISIHRSTRQLYNSEPDNKEAVHVNINSTKETITYDENFTNICIWVWIQDFLHQHTSFPSIDL